jgi:putative methyltransferase (TIGR04325 family)
MHGAQSSANPSFPLFRSFEDAASACGSGYEDPDLIDVVAEKTERLVNKLACSPIEIDQETAYRLALMRRCMPSSRTAVIDVGGACGYYFHLYKRVFGDAGIISWCVVETPSMVAAAKARRLDNTVLTFNERLDKVPHVAAVPTLVLCSSVLQYFPSPAETVKELASLRPKTILVTRTPLSTYSERLISLQASNLRDNGPGSLPENFSDRKIKYPVVFEPLQTIKRAFECDSYIVDVIKEQDATLLFDDASINSHFTLIARRSSCSTCE